MKLKLNYTYDADSPSGWASEEWALTYSSKDDMVEILHALAKVIADFKQKHSLVETKFDIDTSYNRKFDLSCMRRLTGPQKDTLKIKRKVQEEEYFEAHKRRIKSEAKKLGLL